MVVYLKYVKKLYILNGKLFVKLNTPKQKLEKIQFKKYVVFKIILTIRKRQPITELYWVKFQRIVFFLFFILKTIFEIHPPFFLMVRIFLMRVKHLYKWGLISPDP